MYKKPSQPTTTPNINVSKKTNKINEKPQVLQDKRNETTTNDFKNKDEQLLTLIKEHLQLAGYLRSFETLKQQRPNLKAKVQVGQHQNRNLDAQKNNILSFFDKGNRQQFFKNTAKAWFACDEIGKRLEFDVQVYFLIYNIHPNLKRQASLDHHSANAFKKYLQTKADNLAYTKEDLALFAIPYTPQPQKNPAFAYLFTKDWISKIRTRVNEFLGNYFKNLSMSQQSSGGKKVSALQQLYYNFSNQSGSIVNTSREDFKQNCNHTIQMQALKQQNSELRTIIENYHKKFQEFAESSKQNLLQSNQKWFLFSRQIFLTAKRHMKEDKVKLLEKYGSFFSGNVEEMIQANQISLFDKNSYMYEDLSMTPDISKHKIALKKQQSANVNATCQLDYNKIKHLFLQANIREKQIEICTVLKALRDRLNKNFNTAKRKQIIIQYSRGDACGMNQENYIVQKRLIFDGSERIREYYVKLTEALTTTDVIGLQYLSKSKKLIQNLVGLFSSEREESKCFKPVVGILQRLSFSKQPRTQMIHLGIIPMIFKIFKNEGAHLSDFTLQFLTAMMMNLSLKRASKPDFQKHKSELISIVIQHMTSQNNQVRDYINGSIFLLLTSKEIKAEALKQKLDMIVKELLQTRQDDMCSQQYNYILNRLNGQEDDLYKDQQSDDDNQEAEIQEYEEYEDEQYGSLSESSDECIEGQIQIANGEQLLLKNYVLLGPQAMRQQILTRSVLDQTSKRLNNMTTSINRSRRMDNIFVSKANATILQPQLLENILNKKR